MTASSTAEQDVVIVGAGLVGLALAAALSHLGLRVCIVDRGSVSIGQDVGTSDDWDSRVYALSPGSAAFLHGLGAWQRLPCERIAAIDAMEIGGDDGGTLRFSAYELGERSLAWIVENRALHAALVETVRVSPTVEVVAPSEPTGIAWRKDAVEFRLRDGRVMSSELLVAADGVRSWAREQAGISDQPRPYKQTAVVANFATEHAHRGRAFQWFLEDRGILAWLPLPGNRISIVWSAPDGLADELMTMDAAALSAVVASAGGGALGRLEQIAAPARFPLSFLKLRSPVGDRFALVGDAAHGVHPLAGQGVNLGFADVATLAASLAIHAIVRDAGAPLLLERYASRRAEAVLAMQGTTDGLVRLFGSPRPWVRTLRNRGLSLVGAQPIIRRMLAQPALR